MQNRTAASLALQEREVPSSRPQSSAPQNVIGRLINNLADYAAEFGVPDDKMAEGAVILDVESEGFRCILLRLPAANTRSALSPREIEIARLVSKGYPNKMIADILQISCWTVGTHMRRIFAKLKASSRAAAVARLKEERLI